MQIIYLIVGKNIKQAQANIVGKIAEVQTEVGIREFGTWYDSKEAAEAYRDRRKNLRAEIQANSEKMKLTPARGSPGREGRRMP